MSITLFWYMTLRHWVIESRPSTQRFVLVCKGQNVQGFRAVCDIFPGFPRSFQAHAGVCIETGNNCLPPQIRNCSLSMIIISHTL